MKTVRVGISKGKGKLNHEEFYFKAIEEAGGEWELLAPGEEEKIEQIDGLLLPGGGDVKPSFYGMEDKGSKNIDEERDEWEIRLAREFWEKRKPILGICRGMQVLNVALGGTLIQHIEGHENGKHLIRIEKGSFLSEIFAGKEEICVNSSHHQAVDKIAKPLRESARSVDGYIEAIEGEEFIIGVQFHIERLLQENREFLNIFKSFINACRREILTLGTSKRSFAEFLDILSFYEVEEVVDVRRFPKSKFECFIGENLERELKEKGISYIWMGEELGGYRSPNYEAYMQSKEFTLGLEHLSRRALVRRVAIICAEALPWRCHRRFIASALKEKGWSVIHIINKGKEWNPRS